MSSIVPFGGDNFNLPLNREPKGWGTEVARFFRALAAKSIPTTGGTMTLTGELNLGASYGIVTVYMKSSSSNIASSGVVRFANNEGLSWRNAGNTADLQLKANASNLLEFSGSVVPTALNHLGFFASTTSAQLAGVMSDETGSGSLVFGTNPTLDNPTIDNAISLLHETSVTTPSSGRVKVYPKSDNRLYIVDSTGVETAVGSGSGSGGINYISANPDAESATTGWATYKDAAAATPADGTGGSPSVTWTRNTTTPLRGNADFKFSKPASNCQGEGVAFPFTISSVDTNRTIQITFDLNTNTTNYVTADLTCYIYDVTNAVLITPTVTSVGKMTSSFGARFETTTSTSYRLILHVATSSTLAYDLYFENFIVGPGILTQGPAVTDPQSFTPTTPNSSFSATTALGTSVVQVRRITSHLHMSGYFTAGTVQAVEARVSLPSGCTVGTFGGVSATAVVGKWSRNNGTASTSKQGVVLATTGTAYLNFAMDDYTQAVNPNSPVTAASQFSPGGIVYFDGELAIPIAEFTGNVVQLSPATDREYLSSPFSSYVPDRTSAGTALPTTTPAGSIETVSMGAQPWLAAPQASDKFDIEMQYGGGTNPWVPIDGANIDRLRYDGTNYIGLGAYFDGSVWRLARGKYMIGATNPWSGLAAGTRFRVMKYNPLVPAGTKIAGSDGFSGLYKPGSAPGLTTGVTISSPNIGQKLPATVSLVTFTLSGTQYNAATLVLTAGVWAVYGKLALNTAGTTQTEVNVSVSASNATHEPTTFARDRSSGLGARYLTSGVLYINTTGTTVYLVGDCVFTGTAPATIAAYTDLYAIRIA